jgi:uncharacterized protein
MQDKEKFFKAITNKDYKTAMNIVKSPALNGDAEAQYLFGGMYSSGLGVPQNESEASKWLHMAANQGLAEAQHNMGHYYYNGVAVSQDFIQAHMWYNLAAAQGEDGAKKDRDLLTSMMTTQQIAEAQKLAASWKPKIR